jgi:hypothetical protein
MRSDEPMPIEDEARLLRTAPSSNPDGLDLAVEEARAMSREDCARLFGLASLDEVPLVGPGFLDQAPRGCRWYVRFRPAPKNPTPKGRKLDSFELVVKAPPRAASGAGGGMVGNPKRIGLENKDADAARLEALVFLARKQGRRRRATNWPIERIQSLLCRDVLETYVDRYLADPPEGVAEDPVAFKTRTTYRYEIRAFQRAFPELEVGDLGDWIAKEYASRAPDRTAMSRSSDLYTVRRSLKEALKFMGVPPTYNLHYKIGDPGMLPKQAWTPGEYDRLCAAADGWLFNPDGSPKMMPGPGNPVQARRSGNWSRRSREAWRRAIGFLPYTGSRHGRLPPTRWVPPEAEPKDGRPLPDRPWIEVAATKIVYHRDGETRYHGNKRRGPVIVPDEFAPTVRAWFEADRAKGFEFVFHKPDGSRYAGTHLSKETFKQIVEDAGLDANRIPHHLKDLAVEWADEAGMDRNTLAVHTDTTARTIARKYGDPRRTAKMLEAAEGMKQTAWRERGRRKADVVKLFDGAPDGRAGGSAPARRPGAGRRTSG